MRYLLILAFALAISAIVSTDAAAEPEVYMVDVSPDTVDNQQDEEVSFSSDCSVCNGEGMTYFYWNSSADGVWLKVQIIIMLCCHLQRLVQVNIQLLFK